MNVPVTIYAIVEGTTFYVPRHIFNKSPYLRQILPKHEDTIRITGADSEGFQHLLEYMKDNTYKIPKKYQDYIDMFELNQNNSLEARIELLEYKVNAILERLNNIE